MKSIKPSRKKVFISYSREDAEWLERVLKHLAPSERDGVIELWHDQKIKPGEKWLEAIRHGVGSACAAVLLISADFLASDFIWKEELPPLLSAAERKRIKILSLILSPSQFEEIESLSLTQTVNPPSRSLVELNKGPQERYLVHLSKAVLEALVEAGSEKEGAGDEEDPSKRNYAPAPSPYFMDVERLLNQIHGEFYQDGEIVRARPQALSGLDGVGKTQIAWKFFELYSDRYEHKFVANALSRETLLRDFSEFARQLGVVPGENESEDSELVVKAVLNKLETQTKWLLILDNAEDLKAVEEFLPRGGSGHIILTTTRRPTEPLAAQRNVREWTNEEGATFLLRRIGEISPSQTLESALPKLREQAKKLSEALGGLPLALDQAAGYIHSTGCGIDVYLNYYLEEGPSILADYKGPGKNSKPQSAVVTLSMSLERVASENTPTAAAAVDLLRLCAFLDAEKIPEDIFRSGHARLGSAVVDGRAWDSVCERCLSISLLRRDFKDHTLSIHQLVQAVIVHEMEGDVRRMYAERVVRTLNEVFPLVTQDSWADCGRLIQHVLALARIAEKYRLELRFEEAARLYSRAAEYLDDLSYHTGAIWLYERALGIFEKVLGSEHTDVAWTLNNLAGLYLSHGKSEEAERCYKRAMEICTKTHGPESGSVATLFNNLGLLYFVLWRDGEAEKCYNRAREIYEKMSGTESENLAKTLGNLGNLYRRNERTIEQAEESYKRALEIYENLTVKLNPDVGRIHDNLGRLYYSREEEEKADSEYQKAQEIFELTLGFDHKDVAVNFYNRASLYTKQEKYAEAEPLFRLALLTFEKTVGSEDLNTGNTCHALAKLYFKWGQYEEVEALYKRALEIYEKVRGPEAQGVDVILQDYAEFLRAQGRNEEAKPLMARAKKIQRKR